MFEIILILTLIFVAATIMLALTAKAGQPTIAGYIIAGFIITFFVEGENLVDLVQLGILFLAFIMGVRSGSEDVLVIAKNGLKITVILLPVIFIVAFGLAWLLGLNYLNATYFSIAASLSSTFIETDLKTDFKELNLVHRKLAESINVIEDFIAIIILLLISIVPLTAQSVGMSLGFGIILFFLSLLIRQKVFPWLARLVKQSSEFIMLLGLSFLAGFIGLCVLFDVSIIVGAFAAGIALSKSPYNIKLLDTMGSLNEFFSAIFFVTLGALVKQPDLEFIVYSLLIILITLIVKPLLTMQLITWEGYNKRTAVNTALQLDHVSEFALMIAIQASLMGFINSSLFNAIIIASVITFIVSSYTSRYNGHIFNVVQRFIHQGRTVHDEQDAKVFANLDHHVIVVGYGIKGRSIVKALHSNEHAVLVIDNDPLHYESLRTSKIPFLLMDAHDEITWKTAMVNKARLIVVTPHIQTVSETVLRLDTEASIIVSSYDILDARHLLSLGSAYVNVPFILACDDIKKAVISALNSNPDDFRKLNQKELQRQKSDED